MKTLNEIASVGDLSDISIKVELDSLKIYIYILTPKQNETNH